MLLFKYMKINIMSNLEYPLATYSTLLARMVGIILELIGLFFLFDRFQSLVGYSLYEVGLCYLIIRLANALSICFGKGYNSMSGLIRKGAFDTMLIRPRNLVLQSFSHALDIRDLGVSVQYIIMLVLFISIYGVNFTVMKGIVLLLTVISGTAIFLGILMISAGICFFSVKNIEAVSVFTDGGVKLGSYPLTIYNKWITRFFTFIIPFGCANYLPVLYIADKIDSYRWLYMLSPVFGMLFIIPCIFIWYACAKHYSSTGS
ncbi:ABC transporter permease [Acetivibrio sp. MSJd-27]|uniref:ABC transporter permease n=1 Tax=Acetivibrio sp. MSJd-27 TaxID=2841523 RepID=UPI001C128528|nr:ABC-2 family transporter protein [Acetivibrio sp. MSJd-27]MBU5450197.1 ABC-2 family transporter protein [Acetivibrio sp. MSJd-27]